MLMTTDSLLLLVLYVDDFLTTGFSTSTIVVVKRILNDRLLMIDTRSLHFFLRIKMSQYSSVIKLAQAKYEWDLLDIFHMTYRKSALNPFLSCVKVEDGMDTPMVENTLYI